MTAPCSMVRRSRSWIAALALLALVGACSSNSGGAGPNGTSVGAPPGTVAPGPASAGASSSPLETDRPTSTEPAPPATQSPTTSATQPSITTVAPTTIDMPTSTAVTSTTVLPAVEPVGTVTEGALDFGGRRRTYRLYVPSVVPEGPVPLFVGLHGGTGWGDQLARTDHIEGLAESNGFIVVHADGVKVAGGPGGVWNGGMCCGIAARENVDDVGFVNALIDALMSEHDVDPHRIFAFGHSNGGIMSYRLACESADRIVGIGVVAGTLGIAACNPAQPVSVIHIHGTADENVPIDGGVGPKSTVALDFPPPRDGFQTVADRDGCPESVETTDGDVTRDLREPCAAGAAAEFVTIESANHAWPGGTPAVTPAVGAGYADYDATVQLVTFLLSHPRP